MIKSKIREVITKLPAIFGLVPFKTSSRDEEIVFVRLVKDVKELESMPASFKTEKIEKAFQLVAVCISLNYGLD